jgi:hypothetical protein
LALQKEKDHRPPIEILGEKREEKEGNFVVILDLGFHRKEEKLMP